MVREFDAKEKGDFGTRGLVKARRAGDGDPFGRP
jgi:hypothetical protein